MRGSVWMELRGWGLAGVWVKWKKGLCQWIWNGPFSVWGVLGVWRNDASKGKGQAKSLKMMVRWKFSPGRRTVDGKSGWLGASGKPWHSIATPS